MTWPSHWSALVSRLEIAKTETQKSDLLRRVVSAPGAYSLAFANAHSFNLAAHDSLFAHHLLANDVILRDGIGFAILLHWLKLEPGLNLNGTDLIPLIAQEFKNNSVALFGGGSAAVEKAASRLKQDGFTSVVTADGYLADDTYVSAARTHKPRLIILGMGMPKQERIAALLKSQLTFDVLIICGGAIIDRLAGDVPRAPIAVQKLGLEWLFRLGLEPKRLFKRYVIGNPKFLARALLLSRRKDQLPPLTTQPIIEVRGTDSHIKSAGSILAPLPGLYQFENNAVQAFSSPVIAQTSPVTNEHLSPQRRVEPTPDESLGAGFHSTSPILNQKDLFGRKAELAKLCAAIHNQGGHALVFGERGYGKTSIAKVFGEISDELNYIVLYNACSRQSDLAGLLNSFYQELISEQVLAPDTLGFTSPLDVAKVACLFAANHTRKCIFILDEFDRIEDRSTREQLVELTKAISDLGADVHFVFIGVAANSRELIELHPSIHRNIKIVPVRRMTDDMIVELVKERATVHNLLITNSTLQAVASICKGSPYHAQLLGEQLVMRAAYTVSNTSDIDDLEIVLSDIAADAKELGSQICVLSEIVDGNTSERAMLGFLAETAAQSATDVIDMKLIFAQMSIDGEVEPFAQILQIQCEKLITLDLMERISGTAEKSVYRFSNAFYIQHIGILQFLSAQRETGTGLHQK
jgi:N-acetylglucosaminyldiphosphoundecaprenol N-acetyl-beta-D-mannosaminyltransferase